MRIPAPVVVALLIAGLSAPVIRSAHRHTDAWAPKTALQEEILYLPNGEFLKAASLGYDALVADLLWVRATALFGKRFGEGDDDWYTWLYHMVDLATDLDPTFRAAYKYGGTMLRINGSFVDQSSMIFQKGSHHLPEEWYFPFGIGMNYFMHKDDSRLAARYMTQAAEAGGGPFYLSNLAASLLTESNELETALLFLQEELKAVQEPSARRAVEVKVLETRYLLGVRDANEAVAAFRRKTGELPEVPGAVVQAGIELPIDPLGGTWVWDEGEGTEDGEVRSSRYCAVFLPLSAETGLGKLHISGCE